jgi:CheY-like chemotaxis protein
LSSAAASRICRPENLPQAATARPRVVLVDDESSIREIWGCILNISGYAVECYADAASALEAIALGCDCVITDYHMPEMNGVELIRAAKLWSEAEFILMTGNPSEELTQEALAAGAAYVVHKPTSAPVMLQKLAKLTGKAVAGG